MAPDHPLHEAGMAEMVEAAFLPVALPCGIDQREIARAADAIRRIPPAREEALFQRHGKVFGKADADEATGCHRVTIADQRHGLRRRNDLVPPAPVFPAPRACRAFPPPCRLSLLAGNVPAGAENATRNRGISARGQSRIRRALHPCAGPEPGLAPCAAPSPCRRWGGYSGSALFRSPPPPSDPAR